MSYLYHCNIRQHEWRLMLDKPGYILTARAEVCGVEISELASSVSVTI